MISFRDGAGVVVAADVQDAFSAYDGALLNSARMCVSVMEAVQGAGVPVGQAQRLYQSITSGFNAVVEGRKDMVSVVRQLTVLKQQSNLAPQSYGCPDGWSDFVVPSTARVDETEAA